MKSFKIALAQFSPVVGDIDANVQKMIDQVTASDIISVANKYFNNIIIQSEVKQFDKKTAKF